MKILDKLIKWFFNNEPKEKNIDWKETALVFSEENIHLRKELKYWKQAYSDQKKINEINEEKEKW
jgi:hypothetical protein|nr:MAG TPA: hypothetical protein [Caudoviricetes sp.]